MSNTLTLRRTLVVLLATAFALVAAHTALASGRVASPPAAAANHASSAEEPKSHIEPEIGTAIMVVRNADGSTTTYER